MYSSTFKTSLLEYVQDCCTCTYVPYLLPDLIVVPKLAISIQNWHTDRPKWVRLNTVLIINTLLYHYFKKKIIEWVFLKTQYVYYNAITYIVVHVFYSQVFNIMCIYYHFIINFIKVLHWVMSVLLLDTFHFHRNKLEYYR